MPPVIAEDIGHNAVITGKTATSIICLKLVPVKTFTLILTSTPRLFEFVERIYYAESLILFCAIQFCFYFKNNSITGIKTFGFIPGISTTKSSLC